MNGITNFWYGTGISLVLIILRCPDGDSAFHDTGKFLYHEVICFNGRGVYHGCYVKEFDFKQRLMSVIK